MNEKLYYWANNLQGYVSDNDIDFDQIIEIKRLNFFIGKNNAGKSRFLRQLFQDSTHFKEFQKYDLENEISELIAYLNHNNFVRPTKHGHDTTWSSDGTSPVPTHEKFDIEANLNTLTSLKFNFSEINNKISKIIPTLNSFKLAAGRPNEDLNNYIQKIENKIARIKLQSWFSDGKVYIPILRGMRPVTDIDNRQPYIERARKDYFENNKEFNSSNIITGENLYHELKIHLLGEPEQRDLIKSYEEKLSQYFFDNETVSLIPKHNQDVVNIKIGTDKQFPISQLGDGLQQAIILTYEAYIKRIDEQGNKQTFAFFIEEPELHMHAGMVRQLMNFYLKETDHYYFFTTHSNHLLDMADESNQVIIQKFIKQPQDENNFIFKIFRCGRDRDLLSSLGVKPSSVYLANCTIWIEGITDRLYITKYMEKYLNDLESSNPDLYKKYRRFMLNYHYAFVEYAGSNLTHWSFDEEYTHNQGLSAKAITSEMLLIADGDIINKGDRVKTLRKELKTENYFILKCKETENTLPKDTIIRVAKSRFSRMKSETKKSYDISLIDKITDEHYFDHKEYGIGKLIDTQIKRKTSKTTKNAFADGDGVGTIKYKLNFCHEVIKDFEANLSWQLTPKAKEICERIFTHIEKCNS